MLILVNKFVVSLLPAQSQRKETRREHRTAADKAAMNSAKGRVDWKLFNKSRNK